MMPRQNHAIVRGIKFWGSVLILKNVVLKELCQHSDKNIIGFHRFVVIPIAHPSHNATGIKAEITIHIRGIECECNEYRNRYDCPD